MNIRTTLKTSVAAAALFAVAVPVAEAGTVSSGNGNSVTVSGQINKALMYVDDGKNERSAVVDNGFSTSRFRILGNGKVNEAVSVGSILEVEFADNLASNFQINDTAANGPNATITGNNSGNGDRAFGQATFTQRRMEAFISHKQFGKLSIGQGPTASDGTAESSLNGAGVAVYGGVTFFGDVLLRTSTDADNVFGSQKWGDQYTNFDGGSRDDRVRYDTPTFAGFQLSGSAISGGGADAAITYSGKFGGIAVKAAGSYLSLSSTGTSTAGTLDADDQWVVSAAAEHDSGLNIRGHYGVRGRVGRDNTKGYNVTVGYDAKLTSYGETSFAVGYNNVKDMVADGDETQFWEFGVVQQLKDAGTDLYLGVNLAEHDDISAVNYKNITGVIAGTRIKF